MWNKSARLLMVRVRVQKRRGFSFPVSVWVVDEFLAALTDLAWVRGMILWHVPLPRDEKTRQYLSWVKTSSLSGIIAAAQRMIKDLGRYKGLDIVDVETGEVQVIISIK